MNNKEITLPTGLCYSDESGRLIFNRTPTQEEWEQVGRYVWIARKYALCWMADWRSAGRRHFGNLTVEQYSKHLQLEFKDIVACEALEALEMRSENLSVDHHVSLVKTLPDDGLSKARKEWQEAAQRWLKIAEEEKLTPKELKKSIAAGAVVRDAPPEEKLRLNANDRSVGLVTIEGVHMQFNLWLKKVREDDGFPTEWDARRLRMVRDLLTPMADIRSEIGVMILEKGGEV
jgi:hypothetical protein